MAEFNWYGISPENKLLLLHYTVYKFTKGISILMLVDLYHFFGVFHLPSETPVILSFL